MPFTDQLQFEGGPFTRRPPLSCYRTLDSKGAESDPHTSCQKLIMNPQCQAKLHCALHNTLTRQCEVDLLQNGRLHEIMKE